MPTRVVLATCAAIAACTALAACQTLPCTAGLACPAPAAKQARHGTGGWTITVYYTAVESLHDGPPTDVRGCLDMDCEQTDEPLGTYPSDFVSAVHDEGTGRITSGPYAGEYLNWSYDMGYWLDTAPRDGYGDPLVPFVSAAHDTLPRGTHVKLTDCGTADDGSPPPVEVCSRLESANWVIRDQFTPGYGGPQHLDLYLGEETIPDFTNSEWYLTLVNATVQTTP